MSNEERIKNLRTALEDMIGVRSEGELRSMRAFINMVPGDESDKRVSRNAINVLLAEIEIEKGKAVAP